MIKITKTKDTKALYDMCIAHGQETRDMEYVTQAWLAKENEKLVGCAAVKIKNGKFDLAWLISDDEKLKERLYKRCIKYAKDNGAKQIYINKKDWEFYAKKGFKELTDEEMPEEFRYCVSCKKRNVSCFPKSMVLSNL